MSWSNCLSLLSFGAAGWAWKLPSTASTIFAESSSTFCGTVASKLQESWHFKCHTSSPKAVRGDRHATPWWKGDASIFFIGRQNAIQKAQWQWGSCQILHRPPYSTESESFFLSPVAFLCDVFEYLNHSGVCTCLWRRQQSLRLSQNLTPLLARIASLGIEWSQTPPPTGKTYLRAFWHLCCRLAPHIHQLPCSRIQVFNFHNLEMHFGFDNFPWSLNTIDCFMYRFLDVSSASWLYIEIQNCMMLMVVMTLCARICTLRCLSAHQKLHSSKVL